MDRREMLKGAAIPVFSAGVGWTAVFVPDPKPYDPVAVLEAMRDYGLYPGVFRNPNPARTQEIGWVAWIVGAPSESDRIHIQSTEQGVGPFPYFPSAVRWLHEQAAAVDPAFAEAWPVPAEVKQDG